MGEKQVREIRRGHKAYTDKLVQYLETFTSIKRDQRSNFEGHFQGRMKGKVRPFQRRYPNNEH